MKTNKVILNILLGIAFVNILGCDGLKSTCEDMQEYELATIIDVSDKDLYKEIQEDIIANFPVFMKNAPFGNLQECETFKMSIANFSGRDELSIKSTKMGIAKKGLSSTERRRLSNPKPLIDLLKSSLKEYEQMSLDDKFTNSTNITQTILKTVIGMSDESESTLLISSDMIVNNKAEEVNFYKNVPIDVGENLRKLVEPSLLQQFNEKLESGLDLKVIVVHKNEPKNKVNKKNVKAFWIKAFEELNIKDYLFIDNLTNKVTSWD